MASSSIRSARCPWAPSRSSRCSDCRPASTIGSTTEGDWRCNDRSRRDGGGDRCLHDLFVSHGVGAPARRCWPARRGSIALPERKVVPTTLRWARGPICTTGTSEALMGPGAPFNATGRVMKHLLESPVPVPFSED